MVPGSEPYIGYGPVPDDLRERLFGHLDLDWADHTAESAARDWAIEHLAGPHFDEITAVVEERVAKTRMAVRERLEAEDLRAMEQAASSDAHDGVRRAARTLLDKHLRRG